MSTTTVQKLQNELNSLLGLLIINLSCSGLVLAFGVNFLMPNLIQMATTQTINIDQIGLVILGALAFAIAIRWLISTAELIDLQDDLKTDLHSYKEKQTLGDENLTALIMKMTAAYRENKPTLKRMITISKIACALFALGASVALIGAIAGAVTGTPLWNTSLTIVNAAICYGLQRQLIIPHFFGKYATIWDSRLEGADKAEVQLQKILGGNISVEADALRDLLGNPHLLQDASVFHKHHKPLQPQQQNRANTSRIPKKKAFLEEVQNNNMTLLKSTDRAKEYIALFNKTYRELFDGSPDFRL